jgi:LPXTG-site transpeptidase (sortase) family protein
MQSFLNVIDRIMARKWAFLAAFFVIFTLTYALLAALDFLPEPVKTAPNNNDIHAATAITAPVPDNKPAPVTTTMVPAPIPVPAVVTPVASNALQAASTALPKTMTIDALGRTLTILNPASRSVSSLDTALLSGVARHPDSATLGEDGNIFILGHSSYLPVVHNKNYQAFNGIQTLTYGDIIRVDSTTTEYIYRVEKVYKAKASALVIPVAEAGKHLTLATCNSFATTDDRFIVEATLQSTKTL